MKYREINFKEASEVFIVDNTSPSGLRYKKTGKNSGYLSEGNYYRVGWKSKQYLAHRVIYALHNKCNVKDEMIDHIDRNTQNNNAENLRVADYKLNNMNCSVRADNVSGIQGVKFFTADGYDYWCARWKEDGKLVEKTFSVLKLGYDLAKESAVKLREQKTKENFDNYFKAKEVGEPPPKSP